MTVAVKSLLCHTHMDKVYLFTEDDVFPADLPDCIVNVNVSHQQWIRPDSGSTWTYMANMRFCLGKLIPGADIVLYLDTDTLVLQDISTLWDVNLSGKLFGMVREDVGDITLEFLRGSFVASGDRTIAPLHSDDARPPYPVRPYYNSGVMLINVAELVRTGADDMLIDTVNNPDGTSLYPDQDAINLLCAEQIVPLSDRFNVIHALRPDFSLQDIAIKHYASDKPLWKSSVWQSYKHMPWTIL
jgi:lipopolysaccharide biosynthesis glycosyltransferase